MFWAFLMALGKNEPAMVKNPPAMRETCSIPGLGRSPGEGNGYPLWRVGILAWRIPWTIQSMESQRVGHD